MKKYIIKILLICFIILSTIYLTNCSKNKYTITFDENGGTEVEDITTKKGKEITLPIPTKEGYTFLGWYLNDILYEETIMPSENIILVAKWEIITFNITFDEQGGNEVENIISSPNSTIELSIPTKEGYNFLGWYLNDVLYEETIMPSENITLVAKWQEIIIEPTLYTITFDEQDGSSVEDITLAPGKTLVLPITTKEGYNFLGWYLNDILYEETTMPSENITLVAKWQAITCNITFDENGGSDVDDITNLYGTTITLPTTERKYYNFLGWYLNDDLYEETTMYEENIILVAKWEKKEPTSRYGTYEYFCELDGIDYEGMNQRTCFTLEDNYTMLAEFTIQSDKESCLRETVDIYSTLTSAETASHYMDSYLVDIKINQLFLSDLYRKEEDIIYCYDGLYYKSLDTLLEDLDIQLRYAIPVDLFDEVMKYETIIAKVNLGFINVYSKINRLEDSEQFDKEKKYHCILIPKNGLLASIPAVHNRLEFLRKNYIFGVENNYIKTVTDKTLTKYYFSDYITHIYYNISDNPTYEEFIYYINEVMDRYYWRLQMLLERQNLLPGEDSFTQVTDIKF